MKTKAKSKKEFRAVEFMREVRDELSDEFLKDKKKYLKDLKDTMKEFKLQQMKSGS